MSRPYRLRADKISGRAPAAWPAFGVGRRTAPSEQDPPHLLDCSVSRHGSKPTAPRARQCSPRSPMGCLPSCRANSTSQRLLAGRSRSYGPRCRPSAHPAPSSDRYDAADSSGTDLASARPPWRPSRPAVAAAASFACSCDASLLGCPLSPWSSVMPGGLQPQGRTVDQAPMGHCSRQPDVRGLQGRCDGVARTSPWALRAFLERHGGQRVALTNERDLQGHPAVVHRARPCGRLPGARIRAA